MALGFGTALVFGVGKPGALGVLRAVRDWRPVRYAELHNGLPSSLNPIEHPVDQALVQTIAVEVGETDTDVPNAPLNAGVCQLSI